MLFNFLLFSVDLFLGIFEGFIPRFFFFQLHTSISPILHDFCEIWCACYLALYHEKSFVRFPEIKNLKKVSDARKNLKTNARAQCTL